MPAKSEYRLSVTVANLGGSDAAEANMERFMDAFQEIAPRAGGVMGADYSRGTLDATFSVETDDARAATGEGLDLFCEVAVATEIDPEEILDVRATLVAAADRDRTGEFALLSS